MLSLIKTKTTYERAQHLLHASISCLARHARSDLINGARFGNLGLGKVGSVWVENEVAVLEENI